MVCYDTDGNIGGRFALLVFHAADADYFLQDILDRIHIEDGIHINIYSVMFFNVFSEFLFILKLDVLEFS